MRFEWDDEKAESNLQKHGVSFYQAQEVFDDSLYFEFYDWSHSQEENRYIIIGLSSIGLLTVVYTPREDDKARIIAAWHSTKTEQDQYEGEK